MAEKKKILIIDDDEDFGKAVSMMLEHQGFTVEQALNAKDGKACIDSRRPDLIILDVMMEHMTDGFDLCFALKRDENLSRIPILMVTAITEKTGIPYSLEADEEYLKAEDYVQKPISASDLVTRVNKLLNRLAGKQRNKPSSTSPSSL
ncbi:MAG: response regulator [Syntrophaceae bacterium]